jgi:hypothetical protein
MGLTIGYTLQEKMSELEDMTKETIQNEKGVGWGEK